MRRLTEAAIRSPRRTLFVAAVVVIAVTPGLFRLQLRTDGHALVPEHAPEFQTDRAVRKEFGILDPIVILIQSSHPAGVFNPETLRYVHELSDALKPMPGIDASSITSLATEAGFRHRPNSLEFATLLENLPTTQAAADRVRDDVRRIRLYTGTIAAFDEMSTAVYVGTPAGVDRVHFLQRVQGVIAALPRPDLDRVDVIGAPVAEALLGLHILEDLGVPRKLLGTSTFADDETAVRIPENFYELRRLIARGIGLLPVTILLMASVFLVCFRRTMSAAVPLLEVGACLYFVFGLMGLIGIPIYLTIAVVPIILTATGVCDEIHILSRYRTHVLHRATHGDDAPAPAWLASATMNDMCMPVVRTSLTTAVGFFSFVWAPIAPVKMFGIVTTIGVLFCMIWSLTVMPAILSLVAPRRFVRIPAARSNDAINEHASVARTGFFDRMACVLIARRGPILAGFALVLAASYVGIARVHVQDSWIDGFDPRSTFRRTTALFNEQFFGAHVLQMRIDASARPFTYALSSDELADRFYPLPASTPLPPMHYVGDRFMISGESTMVLPPSDTTEDGSEPVVAAAPVSRRMVWHSSVAEIAIDGIRRRVVTPLYDGLPIYWLRPPAPVELRVDVGARPLASPRVLFAVEELSEFVRRRMNLAVGGIVGPAELIATTNYMIHPDDPASRYIPAGVPEIESLWSKYAFVRGPARLSQLVNADYSAALASIYLRDANFVDTAKLMRDIRDFESRTLAPEGVRIDFAGDVAVSQSLIGAIVSTQLQSLVFSVLGILAITMLLTRSPLYALYCVLPCALSLPLVFAAMGWLDIPLGVATSMFAAMIIGAGVDFAIHVIERFRTAATANLGNVDDAIRTALRETGFPVTVNALSLSAGLLVLTLSQVPANARLGILLAIGLVSCLLVSIILLPALLRWRSPVGRR